MRRYRPLTLVAAVAALSLAAPAEMATGSAVPTASVAAASHAATAAPSAGRQVTGSVVKKRRHKKRRVRKHRVVRKVVRKTTVKQVVRAQVLTRPAPKTPAPKRPAPKPAPGPVKIMPMGDSITDQGSEMGFRGYVWVGLRNAGKHVDYVGSLRDQGYPLADADHEGHIGWRNDELNGIAAGTVAYRQPDIVLLMSGSNDLEQGDSVSTAVARMTQLLNTIHAARPSVRVVVLTLIPDGAASASDVSAYNQALRSVVAAQVRQGHKVNLVDVAGSTKVGSDYKGDNVHPNDQGQRHLGAAVLKGLLPFVTR